MDSIEESDKTSFISFLNERRRYPVGNPQLEDRVLYA